ncbi:MAG: hypothetical protein ACYDA8_20690, partial [Deferrisomatales bacterium]
SKSATVQVVNCGAFTLAGAPAALNVNSTANLTAANPPANVTWTANPAGLVTLTPSGANNAQVAVRGTSPGTVTVTATSSLCTRSVTFPVQAVCNLTVAPAGPVTLAKDSSQVLTASGQNGTVTWATTKSAWVSLSTAGPAASTTATALLKGKTVTITATDSTPAGCSADVTINTTL